MESTTEYSVEGCVASRDNQRLCNVTLINASVFVVEGFFAQEGITCQSGTFGQWMDVRSTYCTQRGKDVFDYLKYSLGDTEHKELYYENDIFRLDGIVYIQDGRCPVNWGTVWNWTFYIVCILIFVFLMYKAVDLHKQLLFVRSINLKHSKKEEEPEEIKAKVKVT